jgi:hypothetical protein
VVAVLKFRIGQTVQGRGWKGGQPGGPASVGMGIGGMQVLGAALEAQTVEGLKMNHVRHS